MRRRPTIEELESILSQSGENLDIEIAPDGQVTAHERSKIPWPDPTQEMLNTPEFNAVWETIKNWDIHVPGAYNGYTSAEGNHVRAILDALADLREKPTDY